MTSDAAQDVQYFVHHTPPQPGAKVVPAGRDGLFTVERILIANGVTPV